MFQFLKPQQQIFKTNLLLWFIFLSATLAAQNHTQTLRGVVTDKDSKRPLSGATILLQNTDFGTATDENGYFHLSEIPIGRYRLQVSYTGYETLTISEILLTSGKETVLELQLKEGTSDLREIVVKSNVKNRHNNIFPPPEILTVEETNRLPATFYDPARLTFAYPGVANVSDQANAMIVRGNAPNLMKWQLEGVEIVNPNHTANAGTFSDRPTRNSGGVNMLSAQLLGTSTFFRGGFPVEYGNALSGIMDMRLRNGNNQQHEFTGQIGLIGIDVAAEGPLAKNQLASYLVNYRYSTLGVLSAMGVDLGDEAISFQDLSFKVAFPSKKGGYFSVFGMWGTSENIFEANRDSTFWEFEKDQRDIIFDSEVRLLGATWSVPIQNSLSFEAAAIWSESMHHRTVEDITTLAPHTLLEANQYDNTKFSANTFLNYKLDRQNRFKLGANFTYDKNYVFFLDDPMGEIGIAGTVENPLVQPFANWSWNSEKVNCNLGLHYTLETRNMESILEPRASVNYLFSQNQKIGISYGLHSQLQIPLLYSSQGTVFENSGLKMTKAHHWSLAYENQLSEKTILRSEVYYQSLFDVPIFAFESNSYSALNDPDGVVVDQLINQGTGENYGIEISAQQYFSDNLFWLANASLYESKYKGSDGITRNTRYNGNYIFNASAGKEFLWNKKGKDRVLGVTTRVTYLGGFRETPIDLVASEIVQRTIFKEDEAFSLRQEDYFKMDLRVYFKTNKKKFNSTLALDIQNVTNKKNIAFNYYDIFQKEIIAQNQLGLIPILSYRVEF